MICEWRMLASYPTLRWNPMRFRNATIAPCQTYLWCRWVGTPWACAHGGSTRTAVFSPSAWVSPMIHCAMGSLGRQLKNSIFFFPFFPWRYRASFIQFFIVTEQELDCLWRLISKSIKKLKLCLCTYCSAIWLRLSRILTVLFWQGAVRVLAQSQMRQSTGT